MSLADKMRRSRDKQVEVGRWKFTVRRPTDVQAMRFHMERSKVHEVATEVVVGWSGVREIDLFAGGTEDEAPFDREAWAEFVADHPEVWLPIKEAAFDAYNEHAEKRDAAAKNSEPG